VLEDMILKIFVLCVTRLFDHQTTKETSFHSLCCSYIEGVCKVVIVQLLVTKVCLYIVFHLLPMVRYST
jgi:hypothetical protein